MLGWIIYKTTSADLTPEAYEINRLTEVAEAEGIQLKVIRPEQVDLIVTQEDRKSVQLDGQPISLPDFVLPRMGAGHHVLRIGGHQAFREARRELLQHRERHRHG